LAGWWPRLSTFERNDEKKVRKFAQGWNDKIVILNRREREREELAGSEIKNVISGDVVGIYWIPLYQKSFAYDNPEER
jgi:hypothetical protein